MAQFFPFGTTNYTIDLMVSSASTILAGLSKGDSKAGEVTSITFHGKAPMSNKRHTNKLKATQLGSFSCKKYLKHTNGYCSQSLIKLQLILEHNLLKLSEITEETICWSTRVLLREKSARHKTKTQTVNSNAMFLSALREQ